MKISIPSSLTTSIDHFVGRSWVLHHILDWLEETDERMFLINGQPGAGKSLLMSWLAGQGPVPSSAEARDYRVKINSYIRAVHFCEASSQSRLSTNFVNSIANQFIQNIPGFTESITNSETRNVNIKVEQLASGPDVTMTGVQLNIGSLGAEYMFSHSIGEPLIRLYENGYKEPILVLIDALDEALTHYPNSDIDIPTLLSRLSDLPPNFRILATTRPEPRISKLFRRVETFMLREFEDRQNEDIALYIRSQLAKREDIDIEPALLAISQKASGNFLVAKVATATLLENWEEMGLTSIERLSSNLNGIYADFLDRSIGTQEEHRWINLLKPILGTLSVAQDEGLARQQLQAILNIDVDHALRVCGQYLSNSKLHNSFRLFHRSFADFLWDENQTDYHVDAPKYHQLIADFYTTKFNGNWNQCDKYGLKHLPVHLVESSQRDLLIQLLVKSPEWINAKYKVFDNDLPLADDVRIALLCLQKDSITDICHSINLAFINVLIGIRTFSYNTNALRALAYLGSYEKALAYARTRIDKSQQIEGLCSIATALASKNEEITANKIFEEAYQIALMIEDDSKRVKTLCQIASDIALFSNEQALKIVTEVGSSLAPIITLLDGDNSIHNSKLSDVLSYVLSLASVGLVKEVKTLLNKIKNILNFEGESNNFIGNFLMAHLKVALWLQEKDVLQAKEISERVLSELQLITKQTMDPPQLITILSILARLYSSFGDTAKASQLAEEAYQLADNAQTITDIFGMVSERPDVKYDALIQIASAMAYDGNFKDAIAIIDEIDSAKHKAKAYYRIATEATKSRNQNYDLADTFVDKSIEYAAAVHDTKVQWELLSEASWPLARSERIDKANKLLERTRNLGLAIFDEKEQVDALMALAISLAHCQEFERSLETATLILTVKQELGCTALQPSHEMYNRTDIQKMKIGKRIGGIEGITLMMSTRGPMTDDDTHTDEYEETICIIAKGLAKTGDTESAYHLTESVSTSIFVGEPLLELVIQYANQGELDKAIDIAQNQIIFVHEKAIAYAEIANSCWYTNNSSDFYNFINVAIQGIQHISSTFYKCQLMLVVCAILKDTGHSAEYSNWFAGVTNFIEDNRSSFIGENFALEIVSLLTNINSEESQSLVNNILLDTLEVLGKSGGSNVMILCEVANCYIKQGETEQARQIVEQIPFTDINEFNVEYIVSILGQLGNTIQAIEVVKEHTKPASINTVESLCALAKSAAKSHLLSRENKIETIHSLLPFLSSYSPSVSLRLLAGFSPLFEAVKPGLTVNVIKDAIQIILWERPTWQKLYAIVARE